MLERWFFKNRSEWNSVPGWCSAYSRVGQSIAQYKPRDKRLVLGVATTTRAYAAAFIAFGIIHQRARETAVVLEEDHFLALCELKPGTAVTYLDTDDDKLRDAVFEGCEEKYGRRYIRIRKNCAHKADLLPQSFATRVQVSSKESLDLPKHQRGRSVVAEGGILTACLSEIEPFDYCLNSRLECVLIGNKTALYREVKHTPFAICGESGEFCEGVLQDIVRVRQLVGDGLGYRASVRSEREANLAPDLKNLPRVVLFDGASGFLKWRDLWRESHWVVMLDRTEAGFEEAVTAFNRECLENRSSPMSPTLPELPSQIDVLAYEENRG